MKNKGFTLIELIAVILILGAIALITLPIMNKVIEKSKNGLLLEQINRINNTGKKYILEKIMPNDIMEKEHSYYVTITDMVNDGYLVNSDIKNPTNDSTMNGCVVANYNHYTMKFKYEYMDECIFNNNYNSNNMSILMLSKDSTNIINDLSQEEKKEIGINLDDKLYGSNGFVFIFDDSGNLDSMFKVLQVKTERLDLLKNIYEKGVIIYSNEKVIFDLENNSLYSIQDELIIEENATYVSYIEDYINNDYISNCTDVSNTLCNYELRTINLDK